MTRIRPGGQDSQFVLPGTFDRPVGHSVQLKSAFETELPNCPVGHNVQRGVELKGFVKKEPASQHAMRPPPSQLGSVIFSVHLLPHTVLVNPLSLNTGENDKKGATREQNTYKERDQRRRGAKRRSERTREMNR